MGATLDRVISITLTAATVVVAAAAAKRAFVPAISPPASSRAMTVEFDSILSSHSLPSRRSGPADAKVQLIEFLDLECPACKRYNRDVIAAVRNQFGEQVAVQYVHFPLSIHRLARLAALAAECAADQDRFEPFVDSIYARQDSLGIKPWTEYAHSAGVRDTNQFSKCVSARGTKPLIAAGEALAGALKLNATPTIALNGWRYSSPPTIATLTDDIERVLRGEEPRATAKEK